MFVPLCEISVHIQETNFVGSAIVQPSLKSANHFSISFLDGVRITLIKPRLDGVF